MPEYSSTLEYRDIEGFPGYKVGNDGSVWSCRIQCSGKLSAKWHRLKPGTCSRYGHKNVGLYMDFKITTKSVHVLVLTVFVCRCPERKECRHLDGDASNNNIGNLAWGTRKQNAADRQRHGTTARGVQSNRSDLTDAIVIQMRKDHEAGSATIRGLARKHGLTKNAISCIVKRKTWKHI